LRHLCLPFGLSPADDRRLESIVVGRRKFASGQALYRAGERLTGLYGVRGGIFKLSARSEGEREQVTGFRTSGEVLGFDGISTDRYTCDAVALDNSEVCVIQYGKLLDVARGSDALEHHLFKVLGREIARDQDLILMLGRMGAEERLAAFLLNLSERLHARGYAATDFKLQMRREEIASYLGLKPETISRAFSHLRKKGFVEVEGRRLRIRDAAGLLKLVVRARTT